MTKASSKPKRQKSSLKKEPPKGDSPGGLLAMIDFKRIDLTKTVNPEITKFLLDRDNPESMAKGLWLLGVEAEGRSDWAQAIECYGPVIRIRPRDPLSRYFATHNMAYALIQLKRFEEALGYAHAAIAINESWPFGYNTLGTAYRALGRYAEAIESFFCATLKDPKFKQSWLNLQALLQERPELLSEFLHLAEAVDALRKFLESRGQLPRTH